MIILVMGLSLANNTWIRNVGLGLVGWRLKFSPISFHPYGSIIWTVTVGSGLIGAISMYNSPGRIQSWIGPVCDWVISHFKRTSWFSWTLSNQALAQRNLTPSVTIWVSFWPPTNRSSLTMRIQYYWDHVLNIIRFF